MRQTKITDYFKPSSNQTIHINQKSGDHDKLVKLRNECLRIRDECSTYTYNNTQFIGDMGTLTDYVLALGDKLSLIIDN